MELHHLNAPAVRILFCGRPALTTGVVNLSLLLGGDGQYCLAEKRKARLPPSDSHDGSQGDAAKYSSASPAGHSNEKRESVYRVCSSDGLPEGCYRVTADRHYWVMRKKEESGAGPTTAGTTAHLPGPISGTQATVTSSPMTSAAVKSTVKPSTVPEDALARSTTGGRSFVDTPVTPEDAMTVAEMLLSEKTGANDDDSDDASTIPAARQQKKTPPNRRKHTKAARAAERNADSPPLVDTLLLVATPTKEALSPRPSPSQQPQKQQGDTSQRATNVVDEVEVALGELNSGAPHSARVSAILEAGDLGALDVVPSSQRGRPQRTRGRAKASRVHVDAVGEEGESNKAVSSVHNAQKEMALDRTHATCDIGVNGEWVSAVPHVEERVELATDSPKPAKTSRPREKRTHSDEPTSESPRLGRARAAPSKSIAAPVEVGELEAISAAADLMGQTTATSEKAKCATPTSPAHKSSKSKAATSAASSLPTPDAAGTETLSRTPMLPLHGLPLHHEQSVQESTNERLSHADKYTASTAQEDEQQQQQQQQELADPSTMQSTAPTTSDTTQSAPRSSCGNAEAETNYANVITPAAAHDKGEEHLESKKQPGDRNTPVNPSSIRSQAGTSQSTSNKNSQRGSLSPSAQPSSQWGASAGGASALPELQEDALNACSSRGSFLPSDSPALGFTQVRNTLAEEFSIDMSESESSSAVSEYLYDVEG